MSRRRTEPQEKVESVDSSLAKLPGRFFWNRRTRERVWQTTLPVILRDLAPTSGFDPQAIWKKTQEKEAEELIARLEVAPDKKKGGKGGGGKKAGSGGAKAKKIIEDAEKERHKEAMEYDAERIRNKKACGGHRAADNLVAIRNAIKTPIAKLELLLEILNLAIGCKDKALAFDVFWAIEKNSLYHEGKTSLAERKVIERAAKEEIEKAKKAAKESKKDKKEGKDKDKKKKDDKQKDFKPTIVVPQKTPAGELLSKFKTALKTVTEWRAQEDMIVVQLTAMSDRLPPLSPFTSDFKLDDWQIRVLKLIDKRKSVVICAPTSSGKTVISTYVASLGRTLNKISGRPEEKKEVVLHEGLEEYDSDEDDSNIVASKDRVLFVVPTEPLVWQVAAHFAKHILAGNVGLVTNQLTYSPHKRGDEPPSVVVGTPLALESALTKIRGKTASLEGIFDRDKSKMVGGFDHYGWVVYDEIHSLDGDEGEALQRLIRLMNCNFLALSATVGNAEELRTWMEEVRGQQLQVEVVNAPPPPPPPLGNKGSQTREEYMAQVEAADASRLVKLQEHQGRFINIQRHIWTNSSTGLKNALDGTSTLKTSSSLKKSSDAERGNGYSLQLLHPLSAVTLNFLHNDGFILSSLPMTPQDSYVMWRAMRSAYPPDEVAQCDPHHFFADTHRITLEDSKKFEDHLKNNLERLSKTYPVETQALLDNYEISDSDPDFNICDLVMSLKEKKMHPCLIFHLNVFDLTALFRQLVEGLESQQLKKYPDHYKSLQKRAEEQKLEQDDIARRLENNADMQDDLMAGFADNSGGVVDETAPHQEFCFCPGGPISYTEFNDICDEVQKRDKFEGDIKQHALMRALRRGIGFYINDHHFTAYRIAIMRLAMQGKLGIVLSDNSLAYGVNMPFRTCVFAGEMGGDLDSLMAQQMAGRSGRRGLDTQGHLVYAGSSASFVQDLMLARIPAIRGREPRYHTIFLQEMLSKYSNPLGFFEHQSQVLGERPFAASIDGNTTDPHFRQVSIETLLRLNLIEECDKLDEENLKLALETNAVDFTAAATPSGYRPYPGRANCAQLWMMWEMRSSLPESLIIGCLLNDLYMEFIHRQADAAGDTEHVQITFLAFMVLLLERRPFQHDLTLGYYPEPLNRHPFIAGKADLAAKFVTWENKIGEVQAQISLTNAFKKEMMLLPANVSVDSPLDATIFDCIVHPSNVSGLPPRVKQYVKETLTDLSIKLIHFRNNLRNDTPKFASDSKYGQFDTLSRKGYARLQYISKELIQEFMDFPDTSYPNTERK